MIRLKTTVHNQEGELVMEGEQKMLVESDRSISLLVCRLWCVRFKNYYRRKTSTEMNSCLCESIFLLVWL